MKTYTKQHLINIVAYRYQEISETRIAPSPYATKQLVNEFVAMLCDSLVAKKIVYLRGWGKLAPRFKEGGRPVRDPKNPQQEYIMHDLWTVTRTHAKDNSEPNKLHYSELIFWVENYAQVNLPAFNHKLLAQCLVGGLLDMVNGLNGEERIEFRGLGVFYTKFVEGRMARNPKTGERTFKEGGYRKRFKVSKVILDRLNP